MFAEPPGPLDLSLTIDKGRLINPTTNNGSFQSEMKLGGIILKSSTAYPLKCQRDANRFVCFVVCMCCCCVVRGVESRESCQELIPTQLLAIYA